MHELPNATSSYSQSERLSMTDSVYRPCSACHGDCDSNDDCAAGLICFQRDGSEAVPGCTDPADEYDYCYNPNLIGITATTPTALYSFSQTSAVADCPVGITGQAAHTTHEQYGNSRRVASTIEFVPFCEVTGCDYETKMRQGVWSVGLLVTVMLLVIPVQLFLWHWFSFHCGSQETLSASYADTFPTIFKRTKLICYTAGALAAGVDTSCTCWPDKPEMTFASNRRSRRKCHLGFLGPACMTCRPHSLPFVVALGSAHSLLSVVMCDRTASAFIMPSTSDCLAGVAVGETVILMNTPCLSLLKHLMKVQGGAIK